MGQSYWNQQINLMERGLFDELPVDVEHVDQSEAVHYDGRFVSRYVSTDDLPIIGRMAVDAGTIVELKTCQEWIDDEGSRSDRRRGRWQLQKQAHEYLEEHDGIYCLLVLHGDQVVDGRLLPATDINGLASWTNGGYKYTSPRAIIPWSKIVPP